ncbi:hypothetical protein Tco_1475224 [Tanacetum coccineum]
MIQPEPGGSTQGYLLDSVEVLRFYTSVGNPVNEILLKLNLPDHRILKDGDEVFTFYEETHKLDDMTELPKSRPKKTYEEDLESEIVMFKIPRCMAWLSSTNKYDEPTGSLGMVKNEIEHLDQTKLEDVALTNHNISLSSKEIPSVDEPEPQLLPNSSPLDVKLGDKRGTDPPINPYSPVSFRLKVYLRRRSPRVLRSFIWTTLG